jgi:hypothetical protein
MTEPDANERPDPTHDDIAQRAYALWEARGRPEGSPQVDWFRAEQELRGTGSWFTYE